MKTEQVSFKEKEVSNSVNYDHSLTNSLDDISYDSQLTAAISNIEVYFTYYFIYYHYVLNF